MTDTHELHIRRGVLINDDPQKRCYNGCYFDSHIEWDEWEHWLDYPSLEHAEKQQSYSLEIPNNLKS